MSGPNTPAISCRNVWQVFGTGAGDALRDALARSGGDSAAAAQELVQAGFIPAVQDATFEVADGEVFVIMGLSGSGK